MSEESIIKAFGSVNVCITQSFLSPKAWIRMTIVQYNKYKGLTKHCL